MNNTPYNVTNERLIAWVKEVADLCQPADIHWCDGSIHE